MTCARYRSAALLEAYGEPAGPGWKRHLASCADCATGVDEILEVRRVYGEARPLPLHSRAKRAILSRLRREGLRRRARSILTSLAAVGAAFLLVAGIGGSPSIVAAAEPPSEVVIEVELANLRERIADLEPEAVNPFDSALDELKSRVGSLTWDAENM